MNEKKYIKNCLSISCARVLFHFSLVSFFFFFHWLWHAAHSFPYFNRNRLFVSFHFYIEQFLLQNRLISSLCVLFNFFFFFILLLLLCPPPSSSPFIFIVAAAEHHITNKQYRTFFINIIKCLKIHSLIT